MIDISGSDTDLLVDIFQRLSDFYAYDEGAQDPKSDELWRIYDELAEIFGASSDYDMSQDELAALYEDLKGGEEVQLEGETISDFKDLVEAFEQG